MQVRVAWPTLDKKRRPGSTLFRAKSVVPVEGERQLIRPETLLPGIADTESRVDGSYQ